MSIEVAVNEAKVPKRPNKPGERCLVVRVPEAAFRRFRSRAEGLGMTNTEYVHHLLEVDAQQPTG